MLTNANKKDYENQLFLNFRVKTKSSLRGCMFFVQVRIRNFEMDNFFLSFLKIIFPNTEKNVHF